MGLRLLLTGDPKVGKSTIVRRSLSGVSHRAGFWTVELIKQSERYGFKVEDDGGRTLVLSSVDMTALSDQVGPYHVDVEGLDGFVKELRQPSLNDLLYIDEIGRMQTLSDKFKELIEQWMNLPNVMIGTICKDNYEPFIRDIKSDDETVLIKVNLENRDKVQKAVDALSKNFELVASLKPGEYKRFLAIARSCPDLTLLYKLFHNSLYYVTSGRVAAVDETSYQVQGLSSIHRLNEVNGELICDCPIFSQKRACSHIYSIQIAAKS